MTERKEVTIHIPWDYLDACNGFAFDIGGSVIKAVYIHKDDWKEAADRTSDKGPVRLVNFSREEIKEAFPYIRDRTFIRRKSPEDVPLIYTTGIGGSQFLTQIREVFNVETKNLSEMDCFVQTHKFMLQNQIQADIVHDPCEKALKAIENHVKTYSKIVDNVQSKKKEMQTGMAMVEKQEVNLVIDKKPSREKTFVESGDLFPNLLVMCGSAGAVIKLEEDGTFAPGEMLYRCGRMFLGIGCMLTGAKTYDELMEKAEKGNARNIHQDGLKVGLKALQTYNIGTTILSGLKLGLKDWKDVTQDIPKEDDSLYTTFTNDIDMDEFENYVFHFGKVVGKSKDDIRSEDLARAHLISAANDLAQTVSMTSQVPEHFAKQIFFCGNYVAHPLMRQYVTTEWGQRDSMLAMFRGKEMRPLYFLKHGAHYGALGCLLNFKMKFTDKMTELSEKASENLKDKLAEQKKKKEEEKEEERKKEEGKGREDTKSDAKEEKQNES